MNRQQPLALAPPAGRRRLVRARLLDGAARRAVGSINLAFLDLAVELAEEGRLKQIAGLPPRAIDALIDPEAGRGSANACRTRSSTCAFRDGNFWAAEIAAAGGVQDPEAARRRRAHRVLRAHGDHAGLAPGADARARRAADVRRLARDHRRDRRDAGRGSSTAGAPGRSRPDRALRLARAVLAAVRGLRRASGRQVGQPAAQLGLQIQGADSARGQALQRRPRRAHSPERDAGGCRGRAALTLRACRTDPPLPRLDAGAFDPRTDQDLPQRRAGAARHRPRRGRKGDFFALLGPNGAGKTTTIGIIMSLVEEVGRHRRRSSATTSTASSTRAKTCIGLVPQEINFNQFEKVFTIIVNQAGFYGIPRRKARSSAPRSTCASCSSGTSATRSRARCRAA